MMVWCAVLCILSECQRLVGVVDMWLVDSDGDYVMIKVREPAGVVHEWVNDERW